jgi:hypothetical protein
MAMFLPLSELQWVTEDEEGAVSPEDARKAAMDARWSMLDPDHAPLWESVPGRATAPRSKSSSVC